MSPLLRGFLEDARCAQRQRLRKGCEEAPWSFRIHLQFPWRQHCRAPLKMQSSALRMRPFPSSGPVAPAQFEDEVLMQAKRAEEFGFNEELKIYGITLARLYQPLLQLQFVHLEI